MLYIENDGDTRARVYDGELYVGMLFPINEKWGYKLTDGHEGMAINLQGATDDIKERLRRTR